MWAKFFSKAAATLAVVLALGFATAQPVLAAPFPDDVTITGGDYTLAAGDTIDGDLLVLGGTVTIEDGATVTGDVVLLGGSTIVSGEVNGAVSLIGGSLELTETANVAGDVTRTGGSFERAAGATVGGSVTDAPGLTNIFPVGPGIVVDANDTVNSADDPSRGLFGIIFGFFQAVMWILTATGLALLVSAFAPDQTTRVTATLRQAPWPSMFMGLLTAIAVPVLMLIFVLLALTICLIPFSLLGALVVGVLYGMAWLFGWIALGQLVGARLAEAFGLRNVNMVAATTTGTLLISIVGYLVASLPYVGALIAWFILPVLGIGAVMLTRFGLQPYVRGVPPMTPPTEALEPPPVV